MIEVEAELQSFIEKFDSDNQVLIRSLRTALRTRLPTCAELVWDNYNFFVIGYSGSERPSDSIVSIAASAAGASLSFNRGAELKDPDGILQGSSKVNRFIRLPSAATLARPEVDAMIEQACQLCAVPQPWAVGGKLIIRSVSAKQRPRQRDISSGLVSCPVEDGTGAGQEWLEFEISALGQSRTSATAPIADICPTLDGVRL